MRRAKYLHLLDDLEVKRWYGNVSRGSRITADVYLRRLGAFCVTQGTSPGRLVEMGERSVTDLLMDAVSDMEEHGYAGSYVESNVKAVKSWLRHNRVKLPVSIKITGADDTPTLTDEQTPTHEELSRIFRACWLDARAAAALIAFAGVRPHVIGNHWGTDGLRIEDFLEVEVDNAGKKVQFKNIPTLIHVRKAVSKARHQYLTFLCEEGCRYLKEYWEYRIQHGEALTPNSAALKARFSGKQFIRTANIGDKIRNGIRAAGYQWRPYILRCYFDTQLLLAESKGLVLRDYRIFWMGHKGDIENRYTTNKYRLPQQLLEDMRSAYRRSQPYLQTEAPSGMEDVKLKFRRELLIVAGYSEDEVATVDLEKLRDEDIRDIVRKRLLKESYNNGSGNGSRGIRQKVVPVDEVEKYIESGWEYVSQLPNGKAIVKGLEVNGGELQPQVNPA